MEGNNTITNTTSHIEKEIEEVHEQMEEVLGRVKGKENPIIMGDWNAVVGEGKEGEASEVSGWENGTPKEKD
jgi:hypothetical protein